MLRKPAVAGQFYPSDPEAIKKLIASFGIKTTEKKQSAIACILPHAGYVYSGKVAAEVLSKIEIAPTCIILGPNHTGYGVPASIMREGEWSTPFGNIAINTELADQLIKNSHYLEADQLAHAYEHSIEVELPLIQEIGKHPFDFVPIILASGDHLVYKDIAQSIATSVKNYSQKVMLIASSDMTHYEPQKNANQKDEEAIKAILKLDAEELQDKITTLDISMCGYMPAIVVILAAKMLGAKKAELIAYQTSGDVTGDYTSVVGYAGIVIR
jgi:AmmeMemoRadiSam system protein B